MSAADDVRAAWARLSRDAHIGMSDAFWIVAAAANTGEGRRALAEILSRDADVAIVEPDALSYLRIARDLPLPPGVDDHRADAFFRTRLYTGTRISKSHRIPNPKEFLYFDFAIVMLSGTLDDVGAIREQLHGSGFVPVTASMPDGREKAIATVMVNEFRDTTFGPYDEVIFMVTSVPDQAPASLKRIEYVNAYSLQVPLDRGATAYTLKLWLSELGPIDGGNDYLGTNKELGSFRFEDTSDGIREFRAWDRALKPVVSGRVPRTMSAEVGTGLAAAYGAAAARAGASVPTSSVATIPVASRPDGCRGAAHKWAFAADWRKVILQPVTPSQVALSFGESEWAARFAGFGFTPAISFYSPSGVGQILQRIGDSPYDRTGS